jgi:hypothetical protein
MHPFYSSDVMDAEDFARSTIPRIVKDHVKFQWMVRRRPSTWMTLTDLAEGLTLYPEPVQNLAIVEKFVHQGLSRRIPRFQSRARRTKRKDIRMLRQFDPRAEVFFITFEYRVCTAFRRSKTAHQMFHNYLISRYNPIIL